MVYEKGDTSERDVLDNVIIEYPKGGNIEYKGRFLGSGKKMINRIIEIEKELSK